MYPGADMLLFVKLSRAPNIQPNICSTGFRSRFKRKRNTIPRTPAPIAPMRVSRCPFIWHIEALFVERTAEVAVARSPSRAYLRFAEVSSTAFEFEQLIPCQTPAVAACFAIRAAVRSTAASLFHAERRSNPVAQLSSRV